jgi:capsular exopolysaccharide synthesis family protein
VGRIDDALRRAAQDAGAAVRISSRQAEFVSAWGDEEVRLAPRRPVVASVVDREPEPLLVSTPNEALPALNAAWGERLICAPNCSSALVEEFRQLAATLHKVHAADGIKKVMVTSAAPSDGKTITAINLALALSGSYRRKVLLIDADLRRPSIGQSLGVKHSAGLSEALKATHEQRLRVIPITQMLTLLPSGRPDPDPLAGLTSSRMQRILEEAVGRFDWVILDAPPVGLLADANLMAALVDRVLLVVRAGQTQYPQVLRAVEAIGAGRLLGVVLNAVTQVNDHSYQHYSSSTSQNF